MEKIIGSRSSGKTRALFEYAKKDGATVVCRNPAAMRVKAESYGIVGLDFVGYEDAHILTATPIYIDDIDNYLTYTHKNIKGFTLSTD
jgi:hypothetical protein